MVTLSNRYLSEVEIAPELPVSVNWVRGRRKRSVGVHWPEWPAQIYSCSTALRLFVTKKELPTFTAMS